MTTISSMVVSVALLLLSPGLIRNADAVKYQPNDPSPHTKAFPSTLQSSHPNIQSLFLDRIEVLDSVQSEVRVDGEYYQEICHTKTRLTTTSDSPPSSPTPTKSKSQLQYSLLVDYADYHPSDQVWACYHLANHLTKTTPLLLSSPTPQTLTIDATALPTFISCCPTVYVPSYDDAFLEKHDLVLDYPFSGPNTNLNQVGCGHSHTTITKPGLDLKGEDGSDRGFSPWRRPSSVHSGDSEFTTTGDQNDPYPRLIGRHGYRNTPNIWYYNSSLQNTSGDNDVLTHTEFGIPASAHEREGWVGGIQFHRKNGDSDNENAGDNLDLNHTPPTHPSHYTLHPLTCSTRSFSQDGEGYHRTLSLEFDPSSCYIIDNDETNDGKEKKKNATEGSPNRIETPTPKQPITSLDHRTLSQCNYLIHFSLPNSVFVDPYQISYTLLAQFFQEERRKQLQADHTGWTQLRTDNNDNYDTFTPILPITSTSLVNWFLYDFIDVEAQLNNAVGTNLVLTFPVDKQEGDQKEPQQNNQQPPTHSTELINVPLHLRYGSSQFESSFGSGDDEKTRSIYEQIIHGLNTFLSTRIHSAPDSTTPTSVPNHLNEFRYKTFLNEPQIHLYCPKSVGTDGNNSPPPPKSLLPSISTLFQAKQQQAARSKDHRALPSLEVTVPVGSLHLYPVVLVSSLTVLIATAIVMHIIVIGNWIWGR